jgi:hypothetical protein
MAADEKARRLSTLSRKNLRSKKKYRRLAKANRAIVNSLFGKTKEQDFGKAGRG